MNMNHKTKKGQIVVIETNSKATDIRMKTTHWRSYALARAARCTRQGIVERIWKHPSLFSPEYALDAGARVLVISDPDKQAAAARLFDAGGENRWKSVEAIRDAILAQLEPAK